MFGLHRKIKELSGEGKSIKVGIIGLGQMGRSLFSHLMELDGMKVVGICDRNMDRTMNMLSGMDSQLEMICHKDHAPRGEGLGEVLKRFVDGLMKYEQLSIPAAGTAGMDAYKTGKTVKDNLPDMASVIQEACLDIKPDKVVQEKIKKALSEKKIVVSDEPGFLLQIDDIDVIVDATGNPDTGAVITLGSILSRKHIVTLNVEMDVTIGPILKKMADIAGIVYTLSAGDEPAALKELYDFAVSLGFEVVAAGKGKNNPLDREANPDTLAGYARIKGSNPYMMTSFVDGTKSMIEMACMSNATGLIPDCRGMHGPKSDIADLLDIFRLKGEGGILNRKGIVDFVIGNLAPGVFLVYTTKNKVLKEELKYLLFGDGPNYLLYRPYHLTSMETPISIASAYFYNEPTIVPLKGLVSEVITIAKKDIACGERIDRIGGYTVYGLIEEYKTSLKEGFLPVGLAEGAVVKRTLEKNEPITYNDVNLPGKSMVWRLRRLQDSMF